MEVPLILRSEILQKRVDSKGKFKVMIIDSGAGVLSKSVKKALHQARTLDDYEFYVSSKFRVEQANVSFIDEHELLVDYIGDMDLVIGRAGFNTISECIGLRTPMLLLGEAMNPEMNENIITLKKQHLGSFISMETFENEIDSFLPSFIAHEYKFIAESMRNHTIATNGADVIAKDIQEKLA
jgi:UDP-N-acetylglucosamine:LPS N-acetylglucosamine transferase